MGNRTWIYHTTEEPKIIDADDKESFYEDGWCDSPAEFINLKDMGVDPDDVIAVQQLGDTVQGIVDSLNGALNLDEMNMMDIVKYASDHFGMELDIKKDISELRAEVLDAINGQKAEVPVMIKKMRKSALIEYASKHYDADLDDSKKVGELRAEVQAMIDDNS